MCAARETEIQKDVCINGETFSLFVRSSHRDGIVATTLVHRQDFLRRIGGARFVRMGTVEEVGHLAAGMTQKCRAAGLPMDGQKSVIACPGGLPATYEDRARILREHIEIVVGQDPGVIFGPDMENPEASMDRVAEVPALRDHVTGLSAAFWGLSIDHRGYTGLGVAHSVGVHSGGGTFAVQGWGAVGAWTGLLLEQQGMVLVGLSTADGALVAPPGGRLSAKDLHEAWARDPAGVIDAGRRQGGTVIARDALLEVPCDVFVPAARTNVLALRDELPTVRGENPDAHSVEDFLARTSIRMVAEGANHPLSRGAEQYLEDHGVIVLPDIVVNCGGLIGCAMEWEARRKGTVDLERLHEEARDRITHTVRTNVEWLRDRGGYVRDAVDHLLAHRPRDPELVN